MTAQKSFDPHDDFDALAEWFKQRVTDLAISVLDHPVYNALSPVQRIECMMAGITTGLVGVCFSSIEPDGRDLMMRAIVEYLPQARQNVEDIISEADGK